MERAQLVAALRHYDIRFLADGEMLGERIAAPTLIAELARAHDARLHLALTDLFLLHPTFAHHVSQVLPQLADIAARELQARYMAAVYLQRMWTTRLAFYLDAFSFLPDLFSQELGLPKPEERFGKIGLVALAQWHARATALPFNYLASYYKSADLLFGQLMAEQT